MYDWNFFKYIRSCIRPIQQVYTPTDIKLTCDKIAALGFYYPQNRFHPDIAGFCGTLHSWWKYSSRNKHLFMYCKNSTTFPKIQHYLFCHYNPTTFSLRKSPVTFFPKVRNSRLTVLPAVWVLIHLTGNSDFYKKNWLQNVL